MIGPRGEVRVLPGTGRLTSWGTGPRALFLSNPLADPVAWSTEPRRLLFEAGFAVSTFVHEPDGSDWHEVVAAVGRVLGELGEPVSLIGWSQGAAITQEVALAYPDQVRAAALLATYGRQNAVDRVMQEAWVMLARAGDELDPVRLALGLLSAFPPQSLADDRFVADRVRARAEWATRPDPERRRRSSAFIESYQDRLAALAGVRVPCLVIGFELDLDTCAARAREVAAAIPGARYLEVPGAGHAAPFTHPSDVWPIVLDFLLAPPSNQ